MAPSRARSFFSPLLHVALATSMVAISLPTTAAARPAPTVNAMGSAVTAVLGSAIVEAPASVLGLEGSDGKASDALTEALRKAFNARGYGGGEEMSLSELRLTMGCEKNDDACLAQGGESLGVRRLIYGELKPAGGGDYTLDLKILDVSSKTVERNTTVPVKKKELAVDVIDDTATGIVNSLFPEEGGDPDFPPSGDGGVLPPPTGDDTVTDKPAKPKRKSGLVWGRYNPRPTWKWAAFGTSVTLLGLSAIAWAVTGIPVQQSVRRKGFLYDRLEEKAAASLTDTMENGEPFAFNDVNPDLVQDICSDVRGSGGAREVIGTTEEGQPGVRNAQVAEECQRGENWATVANASGIAVGVFAATTIVFTTLLFVHREKPPANAMLRHGVSLGASPSRDGQGVSFGGVVRF